MKEMAKVSYSNAVGSIMYSMVCTRLDLCHAFSIITKHMLTRERTLEGS